MWGMVAARAAATTSTVVMSIAKTNTPTAGPPREPTPAVGTVFGRYVLAGPMDWALGLIDGLVRIVAGI